MQESQTASSPLKLSGLSPDQRSRLSQITSELKRRKVEERARYFRAIHPTDANAFGIPSNDQHGFIHSEADERWAFGGTRSCKTESIVQDADMLARGVHPVRSKNHPVPCKIRMCAPKWRENVEGVLLEKFKEICIRADLRGGSWIKAWQEKSHKLFYKNGSWIQFKTYEEHRDTYGGTDLDAVYMDEHCPEALYRENKDRLADRDGFFAASMTPEEGMTWEEDHVTEPPKGITVEHWFFDKRGNPYLNPEGVRKSLRSLEGTIYYDTKVKGHFTPLSGRVIPQWSPKDHIVPDYDIPKEWPRSFCIDTHKRTPCAAMWVAWSPVGEMVVYRTIKRFMTVSEWQALIITKSAGENINIWLLDQPGEGDGKDMLEEESLWNQFRAGPTGIPVELVNKSPGSFDSSIFKLWEMFKIKVNSTNRTKSLMQIFESCNYRTEQINSKPAYSLVQELNKYVFKREQKADEEQLREKVRGVHDHYIADLRYIAMAGSMQIEDLTAGPTIVLPKGRKSKVTGFV